MRSFLLPCLAWGLRALRLEALHCERWARMVVVLHTCTLLAAAASVGLLFGAKAATCPFHHEQHTCVLSGEACPSPAQKICLNFGDVCAPQCPWRG